MFGLDRPPGADSPRALVFDNRDSPQDLVDFPVLVVLDPSIIDYEAVLAPGTDLRFFDPDTQTDLPFDVEQWTPGGESIVWVRVPQIDAASSTDGILIYFGPGVAETSRPAAEVWADHALVFHGHDDANAAGAAYAPERTDGATYEPGFIGDAVRLTDTDDSRVTFQGSEALLGGWPAFTLELSIHPDYTLETLPSPGVPPGTNPDERAVLTMNGPLNLGRLRNVTASGPLIMQLDIIYAGAPTSYPQEYTPQQVWSHLVYTFDGSTLLVYRNGIFADFDNKGPRLGGSGMELVLGAASNPMNGWIDEVRVSHKARTPSWVYAQHLSLTRRFITVVPGDELPP